MVKLKYILLTGILAGALLSIIAFAKKNGNKLPSPPQEPLPPSPGTNPLIADIAFPGEGGDQKTTSVTITSSNTFVERAINIMGAGGISPLKLTYSVDGQEGAYIDAVDSQVYTQTLQLNGGYKNYSVTIRAVVVDSTGLKSLSRLATLNVIVV